MAQYTRQEILDKTAEHLFKQGCPAIVAATNEKSICYYRHHIDNGNTLMCAVGALIPDEMYTSEFEGKSIDNLMHRFDHLRIYNNVLHNIFNPVDSQFLREIQHIHDSSRYEINDWIGYVSNEYVKMAKMYKLDVPSVVVDYLNTRKGE